MLTKNIPRHTPSRYPLAVPDGCILYHDFQERSDKIADHSGMGHHGTNNGSTVSTAPYGLCRSFDGTNDYIDCGNIDAPVEGHNDFTIIIAAYTNNITLTSYRNLCGTISGAAGATGWVMTINLSSGGDIGFVADSTGVLPWDMAYIVPGMFGLSKWAVAGITRTGNVFQWYKNGAVLGASETNAIIIGNGSFNLYLGQSGNARYWNGGIGLIQIFNRALSATEMKQLFQQTAWRFGMAV